MKLTIENISGHSQFLHFFGGYISVGGVIDFSETDMTMDELCESQELKNLIINNVVQAYDDNGLLSPSDALRYLTNQTALQDEENERYYYKNSEKVFVGRHTQMRIMGRPLILEDESELTLGEGSDVILE